MLTFINDNLNFRKIFCHNVFSKIFRNINIQYLAGSEVSSETKMVGTAWWPGSMYQGREEEAGCPAGW